MKIKKALTSMVLAGALALCVAGCSRENHFQYVYGGEIGKEKLAFKIENYAPFSPDNILLVTKSDGKIIEYVDSKGNDLKLDYVDIFTNKQFIERYTLKDEVGKTILPEAQNQFDSYLQKIKEIRISQGKEYLK